MHILTMRRVDRVKLALAGLAAASAIGMACRVHAQPTEEPTIPIVLYVNGQADDPSYETYRTKFGDSRGCRNILVTDDAASTISPTIFSTEYCSLTQTDIDNVGEILSDELIGTGHVYLFPLAINQ